MKFCATLAVLGSFVVLQSMGTATAAPFPQPQFMHEVGGEMVLAPSGTALAVTWPEEFEGAVAEGRQLLARRLAELRSYVAISSNWEVLEVALVSRDRMRGELRLRGVSAALDEDALDQAYVLYAAGIGIPSPISLEAASPLGLYYGIQTLCQLLSVNAEGDIVMPRVIIADYPSIAFRLAKTSASKLPLEGNRAFARWLPLMRINAIGLQYHGNCSKNPEPPFMETVATLCPEFRRAGTLKSIVYFCPYRGEKQPDGRWTSYDLTDEADRDAYAERVKWFMHQGADGVEVDYNDWPGSAEVPVADVINLAAKVARSVNRKATVMYCPPLHGEELYYGPASPALVETLSRVNERVLTLWTGPAVLMPKNLESKTVQDWTVAAGRKPFFWINRAGASAQQPFATEVEGIGSVFRGGALPEDFADLVSGVHLNTSLPNSYNDESGEFSRAELIYLATAADYLWNPRGWDAEASARRAVEYIKAVAGE